MQSIDTEVGSLAVYEAGSGPASFLWPSLYVDHASLDPLVAELGRERRCIVVDGPGHGQSRGAARYDLAGCARAAMQILDHLGISEVDWVGNAWGGHVGVLAAVQFPRRIRTLAAIESPMQALEPKMRRLSRFVVLPMLALGMRGTLAGQLAKAMLSPSAPAGLHDHVRAAVKRATGLSTAVRCISLGRQDLLAELPRIACPTLFVAGADDAMWPPELAAKHAALIPDGRCERLAGAAHLGPLERPHEVKELLLAHWRQGDASRSHDDAPRRAL